MYSSYSNRYSPASKFTPQKKKRQKGKSCGYYMRIIFFFSSLIQSLIIVSLVLFLVYGKQADSASSTRIQDLEKSFTKLSVENRDLRQQRRNLTQVLNGTLADRWWYDRTLHDLRYLANTSYAIISDFNSKLLQCNMDLQMCKFSSPQCPSAPGCRTPIVNAFSNDRTCEMRLQLVQSNFTQSSLRTRGEMEQLTKERDNINLDAIRLRRDKATVEKELTDYRVKCQEDFAHSLSGISNVTRAFLGKIDSLFPHHISFQLTCEKQRDNLEQIRSNCTSLSREVEDRFQRYLDNVGSQVSRIQQESSRQKAENWRLREDHIWCSKNRSGLILEHTQSTQKHQLMCDQEKEKLLVEKKRLSGDRELQDMNLKVKNEEIQLLKDQQRQLNASCAHKGVSGSASSGTGGQGQSGSPWNRSYGSTGSNTGLGSTGLGSSKPVSNPSTGSSSGSSFGSTASKTGLFSTGLGSNKPVSNPSTGSSSGSSFGSTASKTSLFSTGLGSSKPVSNPSTGSSSGSSFGSTASKTSLFSTGLGSSKTASNPSTGSSSGSTASKTSLFSTGLGSSKPVSNPSTGSSFGSTASKTGLFSTGLGSSKTGSNPSTGLGGAGSSSLGNKGSTGVGSAGAGAWGNVFKGLGSSSTGLGSTGLGNSGLGRNTGGSSGGTGSSYGAGQGASGTANELQQHLHDLQRYASTQVPETKKPPPKWRGR